MPQLNQFQVPNFASNLMAMEKLKLEGQSSVKNAAMDQLKTLSGIQVNQGQLELDQNKFAAEQAATQRATATAARKVKIEETDAVLGVLGV